MTTNRKTVNRYSISRMLREKKKSNDFFEIMIANLTMEELIGLKLEIAMRSVPTPMLGLPIWVSTPKFVREAIFRAAFALGGSKKGAMRILGMNNRQFNNYLSKLDILTQYKEKKDGIN